MNSDHKLVDVFKLVKKYYDEIDTEIIILNNKLIKNNYMISEKEQLLSNTMSSYNENDDIFIPSSLRSNSVDDIELIKHELISLNETSKQISEKIEEMKVRRDEYNFILSVLKNSDSESVSTSGSDISHKIDFAIKLIDIDKNRAKEELFHVKHFLDSNSKH